jgi:hypothetical protein
MSLTSTKVKVKCIGKKEKANYDAAHPKAYEIEFNVPYDVNSIYYQMSGGTSPTLHTVNQEAADMFIVGNDYDMVISPAAAE